MKRKRKRVEGCAQHPTENVGVEAVGSVVIVTSEKSVRCYLACLLIEVTDDHHAQTGYRSTEEVTDARAMRPCLGAD